MKGLALLFLIAHVFSVDMAPSWLTLTFISGALVSAYFAFFRG